MKDIDLAIVGGGFGGVALAFHLNKEAQAAGLSLSAVIFEPREMLGEGVAYQTKIAEQILNVPALKMGIDGDDPASFSRWLEKNSFEYNANAFVPRHLYQRYLAENYSLINADHSRGLNIKQVKDHVVSLALTNDGKYSLKTNKDASYTVKRVILAMGNSFHNFGISAPEELLINPWEESSFEASAQLKEVAVIGTGLSAVDVVLAMEQKSFNGRYTLISRRGFLPKSHVPEVKIDLQTETFIKDFQKLRSLNLMLKEFRAALSTGLEWLLIIEALRPFTQNLWGSLSLTHKKRFIRHLRPFWDSHRHRIPDESFNTLSQLMKNGRLRVISAKVTSCEILDHKIWLTIKGSKGSALGPYDRAFNCMGLWSDLRRCSSLLIENLIENHLAAYDDLFLGLHTDETGQLIGAGNKATVGLYTLGSLRRGELWETTAVREIREQAKQIAKAIVSAFS